MGSDDHVRQLGPPLSEPPRGDVAPNVNEPIGGVGPNVSVAGDPAAQSGAEAGFGSTHVMYPAATPPPQAQAWDGWPVGWAVPSNWTNGPRWFGGGSDIVFAAIDRNAIAVADMPVVVTAPDRSLRPSPSWLANPQPAVYSSWSEFMRQLWWSYQSCGEAFTLATSRFADGYPRTMMMVDPWLISVEIDGGVRRYTINGHDVGGDVCHVRYASWPGDARGHGPLEVAGDRITAAQTLMRYGSDLAARGGIPWAILKSKYRLTPTQAAELKAQWIEAALTRNGAPAILDAEMDLNQLQVTPKDMALSELQTASEARLAVLLGVPPYLLGLPSATGSSTPYTNVQSIFDYWWRMTLRPHGNYLLAALSGWALPAGTDLLLDASAYTQPEPLERAQFYDVMVRIGAMTIDEVRAAERLTVMPANGSAPALPRVEVTT